MKAFAIIPVLLATVSAGSVDFVTDGVLRVRLEGTAGEQTAFAKAEFLRVMDAVTGSGTNACAGAAPLSLAIDPLLGAGDVFRIVAQDGRMAITGSNDAALSAGVFEVLERLGCRWFWPGEDGEYLPAPAKTLALDDFTATSAATFPYRYLGTHFTRSPDSRRKREWVRRNRLHYPSKWGGHSFNWVVPSDCRTPKEYFERHPEQHALWKGKRVFNQHCYTSPETFKTFVDWLVRIWDAHPEVDYVSLSPKDTPIYCTCDTCAGAGDSSTLFYSFINRLVVAVEKERPDRKYRTSAYSFYLDPPQVKINPAIEMRYCMYNRCYMHPFTDKSCPLNQRALDAMAAWKEALGYTPGIYGYHFDIWHSPLPMLAPMQRVLQDELKWARDAGVPDWHTEWYGGWAYPKDAKRQRGQPPPPPIREDSQILCIRFQAYLLTRLLWNPDLDLDAIKRDWCARVYGPAADEMFAYMTALEEAWNGADHVGGYHASPDRHADALVSDELMVRADQLFAAAEAKLAERNDARAAVEVALEKVWWQRWRDLKAGRDDWKHVAERPDADRIGYLMDEAKPGRVLYPDPENPKDNWTECSYSKQGDGLLWGNHPRMFRGGPWVNYEYSMEFRQPADERRPQFWLMLRTGTERFIEKFNHITVGIGRDAHSAAVNFQHGGEPPRQLVPRTKLAAPLADDWHRLVVRLADTKMRVTLDGTVLYTVDVPLGGGAVNIRSYAQKFDVRDVSVRLLEVPTQDELAAYKARQAGKKSKIDGTGHIIYE